MFAVANRAVVVTFTNAKLSIFAKKTHNPHNYLLLLRKRKAHIFCPAARAASYFFISSASRSLISVITFFVYIGKSPFIIQE